VDGLERQLVEAEKRIKDLGWQIQMASEMDPVAIGGGGAARQRGAWGWGGGGWSQLGLLI